jgi:hypothetical protein
MSSDYLHTLAVLNPVTPVDERLDAGAGVRTAVAKRDIVSFSEMEPIGRRRRLK